MDFFFCQSTESNCVYESDRNGQKSYFTSSALVSGKGWLASISKMLLTKTLGLKVFKMAIGCCVVQKYCINVIYVWCIYLHFVLCRAGPSLRIIFRNAKMRFGLKHDFMNYLEHHARCKIIKEQEELSRNSISSFSPWIEFNIRWEHKMRGNGLSCYIPDTNSFGLIISAKAWIAPPSNIYWIVETIFLFVALSSLSGICSCICVSFFCGGIGLTIAL